MIATSTQVEDVLHELSELRWGVWKYLSRADGGKPAKVPYNPSFTGDVERPYKQAKTNDPSTWGYLWQAGECGGLFDGIGYLLTKNDPYTVIDLDNCIDLRTGEITDYAAKLVEELDSYTEFSPSGTGLHIIVRGTLAENVKRGEIEIYSKQRYMTFTGDPYGEVRPIREAQNELEKIEREIGKKPSPKPAQANIEPVEPLEIEDSKLLEVMRRSKDGKDVMKRLYDEGDYGDDKSRADLRLCGLLAKYTAKDPDRMDRLFRNSALMRKKWDSKRKDSTYGRDTIELAISNCGQVYNPNYKGKAPKDVQTILSECEQWMMQQPWSGRSGPTERKLYRAFLSLASQYGTLVEDGIKVSASWRQLMESAHIGSRKSLKNALTRGVERSEVTLLQKGDSKESNTYLIPLTRKDTSINTTPPVLISGTPLSQSIRLRGKTFHRPEYMARIGPRNGQILDLVHANPGLTLEELATTLGMRKNNLKTRNLTELVSKGFLLEENDTYTTPEDIVERLEAHLSTTLCNESAERVAHRFQQERESYTKKTSMVREEQTATPQRVNSVEVPDFDEIYLRPEDFCIHGYLHGKGCYSHDPEHSLRKLELEVA